MVKQHINLFEPGDHASTFGGNPFACKAGLTVATEIERRGLLSQVNLRSRQLNDGLLTLVRRYPKYIEGVRGIGLIQGLVLRKNTTITAQFFVKAALAQQLLVVPAGPQVIRMVPPLVIKAREVNSLLNII